MEIQENFLKYMSKKFGKFRFKEPTGCRSHNNQGTIKKVNPITDIY